MKYEYKISGVLRKRKLNKYVYEIYVKWAEKPPVGTFFMVWLPGFEAIPLSVADWDKGALKFLVQIRGQTTKALYSAEKVGLMGPLGREAPRPSSKPTLIAGGIGVAPLLYMRREWGGKLIYGARNSEMLIPLDELGGEVIVATEDGSKGIKGTVIDAFKENLAKSDIYSCGPLPMMRALGEMARSMGLRGYGSTEVPVKCGMGICGACAIAGRLLCKEPWIPLHLF
ncbi:dihydroorotate dehydrogenase [Ignicoccus islandicus DSM 13165]|uniref:Dihydroorotate dehydrogenase n=1 Tax=Ignicoccus islandicus DSM 13165 TaxID=940295 RepID=A0A0U2VC96_9CREN|nr:hypothetical protein [Ignicoccus islandicus]ALU11730.1 dihydroorotate dehydrogenase [Ignicoccus islandicus DSM 13165]